MADFLEERLPIDVRMGASYGDGFSVDITQTRGGAEFRKLLNPYPRREISIQYTLDKADLWERVVALYYRAYGMFAGFRVRNADDFSTHAHTGIPSAVDSPAALVSAGIYQLQKQYGAGGTPLAIGLPVRTLYKPVAGSVRVGVSGVEIQASGWTVDITTGKFTFSANKSATITAISKAASAVIACAGHSFLVGESVHVAGVLGMTQINGKRGLITATVPGVSITVAINSSAYDPYASGGQANTRPQTGEPVSAGCEFDLPCRFNSKIDIRHVSRDYREAGSIDIIELVSP